MQRVGTDAGVIQLLDFFELPNEYLLVLERPEPCPDLFSYARDRGNRLDEDQATDFPRQLVQTLQLCHERGVLHRDVKPENILVQLDTGDLKLLDFGCGCDLQDSVYSTFSGPGVLTRTLLNSGAQRIVALESDKAFLPDLQVLENSLDGQLEVVHCDFFKLDPIGQGTMRPPAMYSEKLFNNLGISEVPWTEDVPVKVVGIFSQRNERNMLWKLVYALYERLSIFRYGRVELLMFISEKEYTKLVCSPGDMKNYMALGCLWQMACDIQLLHKEPWSSFLTTSKSSAVPKSIQLTNDHLCLVRITPRRDLFSATLTPSNTSTLVMMIKQCLAKRKAKLADRLNSWSPGSGAKLLRQVDLPEDILTGLVYPEEYKRLFEAMEHSEEFTQSWLYEEILENTRNTGCQ
ncbi:TFB2M transferase, partial [Amia calva]|nr:TFB2M transferase [Amia calva]